MAGSDFASPEPSSARWSAETGTDLPVAAPASRQRRAGGGRTPVAGVGELAVDTVQTGTGTVLLVFGEVDVATMEQFAGALDGHLTAGARAVVIDLSGVRFISVDGGRVLLTAVRRARRRGLSVRVVLSSVAHRVVAVFDAVDECETDPVG